MKQVIQKANVLIEALPHIQQFRGDTVVVKFGGSSMDNPDLIRNILEDIAFMSCVGMRPVLVHGGGKSINMRMKQQGLQATFLQGLRVTDAATIEIVEQVLNREVNPHLVDTLNQLGCKARGIHGEDIITARRHTIVDPDTGNVLDWGFVGAITRVDVLPVKAYLEADITPVITPLGADADQHLYNINADAAAAALAERLQARKLVFLSDVPGLLADPTDRSSLLSTLHLFEVEDLVKRGVIAGGMLPKIDGALKALKAGVRKTHIIDAALPHSLLLELFTDKGIGTEIVRDDL
ncbi:MAG: acetylglutamate kinase [Lentisphaerae bacterium]|jgi:acetylglutamate kinase|nr:acetylglutamate kinase [Lentisphaerota bacterium]